MVRPGGASGSCDLCPPVSRRRRGRGHRDNAVQWCGRCNTRVCARHVQWDSDAGDWVCARCDRGG